jgi:hypothetical protein
MLKRIVKDSEYFVIAIKDGHYALWFNDCAWQETNDIGAATQLSEGEIDAAITALRELGYNGARPEAVERVFRVYDVPKKGNSTSSVFDAAMAYHPYYLYPRMSSRIIKLKTDYSRAVEWGNEALKQDAQVSMYELVKEYKEKGVMFCPACNQDDGTKITTPSTFGSVLKWTRVFNSYEGHTCEVCSYQKLNKIEHWN